MTGPVERDNRVAAWLRADAPPSIDDAVLLRIDGSIRSVAQRHRAPLILRAVGAAVVVATVALGAIAVGSWSPWLESSRAPRPSTEGAASPSAVASLSPSSSTTPIARPLSWTPLVIPDPRPEEGQGEDVYDVVAGGPGFVAVGRSIPCCATTHDDNAWTPGIWTSVDGVTWEAIADVSSLGAAELHAVATGPDGRLLAIGYDMRGYGPDEEPLRGLGMWSSSDGLHWEPVSGPDGSFRDVVATDDGWLVVGFGVTGAAVFSSTDLEAWSVEELPGGGDAERVTLDAEGRALIIGTAPPEPEDEMVVPQPRGWIGRPGDWQMIGDLPAGGPAVAIGTSFTIVDRYVLGGASWSSEDGLTWDAGEPWPAGEGGGDQIVSTIETLMATGDGLVAGGTLQVSEDEWVPAVWRSPNGRQWLPAERLPLAERPQETAVSALIESPAGLVALGYAYYEVAEAAGWLGP